MQFAHDSDSPEQKPTHSYRWSRLYTFVVGELVLLIVLFYLFTKAFE